METFFEVKLEAPIQGFKELHQTSEKKETSLKVELEAPIIELKELVQAANQPLGAIHYR